MRQALVPLFIAQAVRAVLGAAIGLVLWLMVTALAESLRPSPMFVGLPPGARIVYEQSYRVGPSGPAGIRGTGQEALEEWRETIRDYLSTKSLSEALALIQKVPGDTTRDILRLDVITQLLLPGTNPPSAPQPVMPSDVQIADAQQKLARFDERVRQLRGVYGLYALQVISSATLPHAKPISVLSWLVNVRSSEGPNYLKQLDDISHDIAKARREIADQQAAKQAADKVEKHRLEKDLENDRVSINNSFAVAKTTENDVYRAEAFRMIANAQRRIDPIAASETLEKAVRAALKVSVQKEAVAWWANWWLWVLGGVGTVALTFLINLFKPTADSFGEMLKKWGHAKHANRLARKLGEQVSAEDNHGAHI